MHSMKQAGSIPSGAMGSKLVSRCCSVLGNIREVVHRKIGTAY